MLCSMYRKQPHYCSGADSINILSYGVAWWHDGVMVSILHPGLCGTGLIPRQVTAFCSWARHLTSSHSDSLHHMYYIYRASDRSQKKKSNFVGFSGSNLWKMAYSERNLWKFFRQVLLKNDQLKKTADFVAIFCTCFGGWRMFFTRKVGNFAIFSWVVTIEPWI